MTLFPEPAVSRVSGIRKGLLVDTRKATCAKGPDWVLDERNQVAYTAAGLKKICEALKLDQAGLAEGVAAEDQAPDTSLPLQGGGQHAVIPTSSEPPAASTLAPQASEGAQEKNPPEATDQAAAAIAGAVAAAPGEVEVVVTSVPVNGNRQLLYGTIEDAKEKSGRRRVSVRVRDNAFFLPGFVVQATPAGPNYFNFVGRLPRWKGDKFGFTAKTKPKEPDGGTT
jgi:hypothetical protein